MTSFAAENKSAASHFHYATETESAEICGWPYWRISTDNILWQLGMLKQELCTQEACLCCEILFNCKISDLIDNVTKEK